MERGNSFSLKSFLEQWLPRLVALGILAYLVYSLLFKQDHFSWLHIIALAIAVGLILAPMASRLRVSNLIDFKSKLDVLEGEQRETKAQLNQLTNQISTAVTMRVNPVQVISFEGLRELLLADQQGKNQFTSTTPTGKDVKYTKDEFLRRANGYRYMAFPLLMLTRSFQLSIDKHQLYFSDIHEANTLDETLKYLVNSILDGDLATVFSITLTDEEGTQTYPVITPAVIEGFRQINSLVDLYRGIQTGQEQLPSAPDIHDLFTKVEYTLATLATALQAVGSNSILYRYRVHAFIKGLRDEIHGPDTDSSSTSTSPPNHA